jgi:3-methyladenine DNA glycosylase Mpg
MKLSKKYFQQEDVVFLAKDLVGKLLVTEINGIRTGGIITETEAYSEIEKGVTLIINEKQSAPKSCLMQADWHMFTFVMACIICLIL